MQLKFCGFMTTNVNDDVNDDVNNDVNTDDVNDDNDFDAGDRNCLDIFFMSSGTNRDD